MTDRQTLTQNGDGAGGGGQCLPALMGINIILWTDSKTASFNIVYGKRKLVFLTWLHTCILNNPNKPGIR